MSNTRAILTPTVNIAETVFAAVENQLPDDADAFYQPLNSIRHLISKGAYFDLELAANLRAGQALENGFVAGWELRGKAQS